jgi:uncharacterized protein YcfL
MRRYVVAAVLAAALLSGCQSSGDEPEYDGGPAVVEGKIIGKGIYDGCNRLTLSRVDKVYNKRLKYRESKISIGYICIPRNAWNDLKVDDMYEVPKP